MSYTKEYAASIYLTFAGRPLTLSGNLSDEETVFSVEMPPFTLGELINGIIHMVKPSYTLNFDAPWSSLLDANIGGFTLSAKVPRDRKKPTEFGFEYKKEISGIPGFKIDSVSVFARSIREVNFNLEGSLDILGFKCTFKELFGEDGINLLDPQGMPKPAPKSSLFKLNFLGAGQHLELQKAATYNHVNEVVDELKTLMQPPPPGTVVPAFAEALKFNNNSQWLFAIDAVVMDTVSMKIAFNDPALYGLFLSLHGDKAKVFKGLEFEILYKKITDDIGVYQIELKLPDAIRNIELGAVSITLPIVGIWIYTNGNFKIDLGFPYNNDFSRSFTVQAFPFTGAGGFYFAVLNGSTSLTLPTTDLGAFNPVLEFGIGLNLGLGKTFNKGILSAGLSIVFYGIVEGTLAWFEPDKERGSPQPGTDLYYKLKGTFGIVGHIYGTVNFAIISATLDIMVYAQATITMEAAEVMLLAFEAGVTIELTVRIKLCFFSINIHLSFSATVREQFNIGAPADAQWKVNRRKPVYLQAKGLVPIPLNWGNLVTLELPQPVDLYFIPIFSVVKTGSTQSTVAIASLFTENDNNNPLADYTIDANSLNADSRLKAFDKLCTGLLSWAFAAADPKSQTGSFAHLLTDQLTAQQIDQLMDVLNQTDQNSLFSYQQVINFIRGLFTLNIKEIPADNTEEKTLALTVFPIIPALFLSDPSGTTIDFSKFNAVNDTYTTEVLKLVAQFTDQHTDQLKALENELTESMASLLFRDYFQLLVKSLVQAAQEYMESNGIKTANVQAILNAVYQNNGFSKAGGSASRFALHGLQLPKVKADGSPEEEKQGLYQLSGQQLNLPLIEDVSTFSYTLTLSKTDPKLEDSQNTSIIDWITFNGQLPEVDLLTYPLTKEEIDRIKAYQTVDFKVDQSPTIIKLYKDQNRVFAFSNPIKWNAFEAETMSSIWTFPSSLLAIGNSLPNIDLKVAVQSSPSASREVTDLPQDKYFYGTLLPITIKKVNNQSKEKINERTFEVFGTDATGITTLTSLLRSDELEDVLGSVSILYASDSGNDKDKALKSDDLSKLLLLLINTNLSTETNPESLLLRASQKITNTTALDFVSRLWKSSLVRTGGYYLYYDLEGETLPNSLFDKNGNGEIYLLIRYKRKIKNEVTAYMNMAGIGQEIDTAATLLYGEWNTGFEKKDADIKQMLIKNQLVRSAVLKPGNIGFELNRKNPEQLFTLIEGQENYQFDLQLQYNLLNYEVKNHGPFKALKSIAPVGPVNRPNDVNWYYTKAMPIGKFYTGTSKSAAYMGLGETVEIGFDWQDNYGNNFKTEIADVTYKILYFDQLVPFSAWPSLTIDYYFLKPAGVDNYALTFHFVPGQNYSFKPDASEAEQAAVVKQANESLKVYQEILDQLEQVDVKIALNISVDPATNYSSEQKLKAGILGFIATITQWIGEFMEHPVENNQYPGSPNIVNKNYIFNCAVKPVNSADIFALSTNIVVSRAEELIDPQFIYDHGQTPIFAPGVQQITNVIKPKVSDFKPANEENVVDKSLGLRNFASNFEQAFGSLTFKLAATYIGEQSRTLTAKNNEELWVVRIKNEGDASGISCWVNYDQVNFYAPQPLANFLFTLPNIAVYDFDFSTGKKTVSTQKSFYAIDSEAWAIKFLQSLETVLGADLSLPITMIDHLNNSTDQTGILAKLIAAKQTVAEAIALQTIPILANNHNNEIGLSIAAEKLKQQLLINLYNGYLINAVVQYEVDMESPYPNDDQGIAPNYYGKPFIQNATLLTDTNTPPPNHSFSTAKIPLKNFVQENEQAKSYLTYTFESKTPSLSTHVKLPIHYNITHVEFDIQKLKENASHLPEDLKKFEISSWLNFIIPFDAATKTPVETTIPIPLRQYPALPVFGSQLFEPKIQDITPTDVSIEDAKLSSFKFDYSVASFVAQDSYNFEVYFNTDPNSAATLHDSRDISAKQKNLFTKLAQFSVLDQEFLGYFKAGLPTVSGDTSQAEREVLTDALHAYADLSNQVSDAWYQLYAKNKQLNASAILEIITAKFKVVERAVNDKDPNSLFELELSNWTVRSADQPISYVYFPDIIVGDYLSELYYINEVDQKITQIPDGKNPADYPVVIVRYYKMLGKKKTYLNFGDARGLKSRSVTFKNLSVLLIQNAWGGLRIERNSDLINGDQTASEFIYTTPLNRFNNPIMPSLAIANTFALQPPSPAQNSLKDYIQNLLAKLMVVPGKTGDPIRIVPASLKILVQYKFKLEGDITELPFVTLPIALMPPTLFTEEDVKGAGDTGSVHHLSTVISNWFTHAQPSMNQGFITFSIFFYSNLTGTTNSLPLLILDNLEIDVNKVSDLDKV